MRAPIGLVVFSFALGFLLSAGKRCENGSVFFHDAIYLRTQVGITIIQLLEDGVILCLRGLILRKIQASLTLPENKKPRQWTGHSFRVGAAVDLVERGYTIEQVMRKGDWKSVRSSLRYLMAE